MVPIVANQIRISKLDRKLCNRVLCTPCSCRGTFSYLNDLIQMIPVSSPPLSCCPQSMYKSLGLAGGFGQVSYTMSVNTEKKYGTSISSGSRIIDLCKLFSGRSPQKQGSKQKVHQAFLIYPSIIVFIALGIRLPENQL